MITEESFCGLCRKDSSVFGFIKMSFGFSNILDSQK
jgi:hypothetical protein